MTVSFVIGLTLVVGAPAAKEKPKKDPPGPVGRWTVESATFAGMPLPKPELTISFTADGKYETRAAGGDAKIGGTFTLDPKKDPPEMDLTDPGQANPGKVSAAIYKIDGDTLTICSSTDGERPRAFDAAAGSKFVLLVLKRTKD
jgi:uncharacterized protein (TIGR03067 family)